MNRETKVLGAILIFSLVLIIGAVFLLGKSDQTPSKNRQVVNIDYSKGQKIGSDSAKVKLVEFSDLQCPACKAAEPFVKQTIEKNKDNLQFIYMHFPLPQHIHGREAANAAEAAGAEGKFWLMHDKLFETQDSWSTLGKVDDYFANLAKGLNLNADKIKQAVDKDTYGQKINATTAEGNRVGVNATPTFFLNGRKLNLINFSDLENLVDQEIKNK